MATFGKIGARHMMKEWTARDYVQDGLVFRWDGIENAGYGSHESSLTSLIDLSQNAFVVPFVGAPAVSSNHIEFTTDDYATLTPGSYLSNSAFTVGCLFQMISTSQTVIISSGSGRYISASRDTDWCRNGNSGANAISFSDNITTPTSVVGVFNYDEGTIEIYVDGAYSRKYVNGNLYSPSTWTVLRFNAEYRFGVFTGAYKLFNSYIMNRALTADEIAYNYNIDKLRFGL